MLGILERIGFLLKITRTHAIIRRYFVVNGFDGALTILGIIIGFMVTEAVDLTVALSACIGATVALGVSGISSAYVSEAAERKRALTELEDAMVKSLRSSDYGLAARWVPLLVALVNGAAPVVLSLIILIPLFLGHAGFPLPFSPFIGSLVIALVILFLLGVYLGKISEMSWMKSGMQTLLIALITIVLILLVG